MKKVRSVYQSLVQRTGSLPHELIKVAASHMFIHLHLLIMMFRVISAVL